MSEFTHTSSESDALWTPGSREVYQHYPQPKTPEGMQKREDRLALLRAEYQDSIERYANAYYERGLSPAKFGAALGKSLIRIYQTTGDIGSPDSPYYQSMVNRMQRDQAQLRKLLPEFADIYLNGILSEFAIANTLANPSLYNAEVFFPDESEENYEEGKGVDWWVDMSNEVDESRGENPYAIALQIKSVPLSTQGLANLNYQLVYPVRTDDELDNVLDLIIKPENMTARADLMRIGTKIHNSMGAQLDMQEEYSNVAGALVLVPTPQGETSFINRQTGQLAVNNPLTNPKSNDQSDFWEQLLEVTPLDRTPENRYNSLSGGR